MLIFANKYLIKFELIVRMLKFITVKLNVVCANIRSIPAVTKSKLANRGLG